MRRCTHTLVFMHKKCQDNTHTCTHTYIHAHTHTHTCTQTHKQTHTHTHTHTHSKIIEDGNRRAGRQYV